MKDYSYLVSALRTTSTLQYSQAYAETLWEAAYAIEELQKERDAAVADLKEISYCCNCCQCTERDGNNIWCVAFGDWFEWYDTCDEWEWRGVTDE